MPVVIATTAGAGALVVYAMKGVEEEEIPKISLVTGVFFAISLISIPVGPSSVHPIMGGLAGIILGRRAPLAFFIGLLLQAMLFQHGGLTTLGANTLMLAIPALLVCRLFHMQSFKSVFVKGALAGGFAVVGTVIILIGILLVSDQRFGEGFFSVVNLLIAGHIPLAFIEGFITGAAVRLLYSVRPALFNSKTPIVQ